MGLESSPYVNKGREYRLIGVGRVGNGGHGGFCNGFADRNWFKRQRKLREWVTPGQTALAAGTACREKGNGDGKTRATAILLNGLKEEALVQFRRKSPGLAPDRGFP
jgi:hypothetical protein